MSGGDINVGLFISVRKVTISRLKAVFISLLTLQLMSPTNSKVKSSTLGSLSGNLGHLVFNADLK